MLNSTTTVAKSEIEPKSRLVALSIEGDQVGMVSANTGLSRSAIAAESRENFLALRKKAQTVADRMETSAIKAKQATYNALHSNLDVWAEAVEYTANGGNNRKAIIASSADLSGTMYSQIQIKAIADLIRGRGEDAFLSFADSVCSTDPSAPLLFVHEGGSDTVERPSGNKKWEGKVRGANDAV